MADDADTAADLAERERAALVARHRTMMAARPAEAVPPPPPAPTRLPLDEASE